MAIPIAVARIIAITQGRTPERKALTPAYFIRFLSTAAIKSIIMKGGRTTPSVARNEPRMPPCVEPINVAILTASGPGVDFKKGEKQSPLFSHCRTACLLRIIKSITIPRVPQAIMIPYQAIFSPSIPKRFSIAYRFNSLFSRFSQSTRSIR